MSISDRAYIPKLYNAEIVQIFLFLYKVRYFKVGTTIFIKSAKCVNVLYKLENVNHFRTMFVKIITVSVLSMTYCTCALVSDRSSSNDFRYCIDILISHKFTSNHNSLGTWVLCRYLFM